MMKADELSFKKNISQERWKERYLNKVEDDPLYKPGEDVGTDFNYKHEYVWPNVIFFIVLHLSAIYGFYLFLFKITWLGSIFLYTTGELCGFGVTVGAHRLFAHRTYKATWPFRLFIILIFTHMGQNSVYRWAKEHRQHHKYTDTDADPHNARRGFFFSHMGWLMVKPHPAAIAKKNTIDMSDLKNDPLVMFNRKYFFLIYALVGIIIPVGSLMYFFQVPFYMAFFGGYCFRYCLQLHRTWTTNSVAHKFGSKPYDKHIFPSESALVSFLAHGEGWHNYHHSFPWDYKTELGTKYNPSSAFINFLARLGLVYDLKTASKDMISKKILRTGDGSYSFPMESVREINEENRKNELINELKGI